MPRPGPEVSRKWGWDTVIPGSCDHAHAIPRRAGVPDDRPYPHAPRWPTPVRPQVGRPIEQIRFNFPSAPARQIDLRGICLKCMIDVNALVCAGGGSLPLGDAAALWTEHDLYVKYLDSSWHCPQLTEDGADRRASRKVRSLRGLSRNWPPECYRLRGEAHLNRGGCIMVEQLRSLGAVAGNTWHLFCGPLRIRGTAGSIIRACALANLVRAQRVVDMTHEFLSACRRWARNRPTGRAPISQAHLYNL